VGWSGGIATQFLAADASISKMTGLGWKTSRVAFTVQRIFLYSSSFSSSTLRSVPT